MLSFAVGSTSISLDIQIVDDAGLPVVGLLAATFPTLVYSSGAGVDVALPALTDLSLLTSGFTSGGLKERAGGYYRLDVPNSVFAAAGIVAIRGEDTDKRLIVPRLQVGPLSTNAPAAAAIREELDSNSTKLANLDTNILSRMPSGAVQLAASQPHYAPAVAGAQMTLTSGERTAVANAVESEIIDDTDSEKVLTAITDKIAAANPSLGDLTLAAIASAVRTNLATELGRIDVPVSETNNATAVAELLDVLNGIKGEGWTNQTLVALFNKDVEATIGDEQIQNISDEISQALADQGITVAEFAVEALSQLVSVKAISLISPFTAIGDLVLQIGDDYLAADGTSLDWSNAAGSWGDLTDCAIEFRSSRVVDQVEQPNAVVAGSVLVASGSGQKVRVELPASWTLQLSPGAYAYQLVRITSAGKERTLRRGSITALRKIGVPS